MKTAKDIISYLDAELEESYRQYKYWKNIDSSEAKKYLIRSNTIESILDDIALPEEPDEPQEPIAKILTSNPAKEKPKKTFSEIYFEIFFIVISITSYFTIESFISDLLDKVNIDGILSALIHFGYLLLHFGSFLLILANFNRIIKAIKEGSN